MATVNLLRTRSAANLNNARDDFSCEHQNPATQVALGTNQVKYSKWGHGCQIMRMKCRKPSNPSEMMLKNGGSARAF